MQTKPQRRQGQESCVPESLFEVNGRSRKSKLRCSSKAKRRVKITSRFRHGGLRLVRFVLQSSSIYSPFFMARFGMRELRACSSRHVHLHSSCLSHDRAYCSAYAMETPRDLKCIRTVGKIEQLLCRSANLEPLTCRFARENVSCRLKKPCKT